MKISDWGVFEVKRDNVGFLSKFGKLLEEDYLARVLPFGALSDRSVKQIRLEDKVFFSVLLGNSGSGKGIVIVGDASAHDGILLDYIPGLEQIIRSETRATRPLLLNPAYSEMKGITIKDFDVAIYSLLTKQKVVIFGTESENHLLVRSILEACPQEFRNSIEFVTQTTSLAEKVNILGMPYAKDVTDKLETFRDNYTAVLANERAYGINTSKKCRQLSQLLVRGEFGRAQDEVRKILSIAKESQEISTVFEFAEKKRIPFSDAQLILTIRAACFKLPTLEEGQEA